MKSILLGVTLILGLSGCTMNSAKDTVAWGALAIDSNQGQAYGLSYDHPTAQAADARALKECGSGCRVVKNFAAGCGAYAADQARGGKASGVGTASTEQEAKTIALRYCRQYGGSHCIIRVWSCNTRYLPKS
jgi:Domain of unknown function (DUF4189)